MSWRDRVLRLLTVSLFVLLVGGWVAFFSGDNTPITTRQKTFAQGNPAGYGLEVAGGATEGCTADKVPVLMYHHIRHCPEGSVCGAKGSVEYGPSVDPVLFARQLATLKD